MPTLLAIETSNDACSVAACHNDITQEIFVVRPREHNKILLPMVAELLQGLRLTFADLDAIAFGVGPGSFTGLRLSAGVVQGLAFASRKPVIPVSSLAALAFSAGEQNYSASPLNIITVLDARMQDVYFAAFRYEQTSFTRLVDDELMPAAQLPQRMENYNNALVVGDGWPSDVCTPALHQPAAAVHPHAKAVLELAKVRWHAGETVSAEQALPVYLRETVSWQKWRPKSDLKTTLTSP